ncbi:esterase [Entomohabitans teleogrylli]|uniref:esterase n=1 Tax=Entomohabitans teleogrylli TaxID=1384589 RepID=UPI00073D6413|nr:esterase [Entomohabitans teleogrylli]
MIEIYTESFAGIETLHAVPAGKKYQPLPCVLFYHGFTSSRTVYSYFAVALAQAGLRVVMPDAARHGARYDGDEKTRIRQFWQILHQNMLEFPALRDALVEARLVSEGRLGVGGASMGGMTALGVMTHYPQARSVACLMGSGYYLSLAHTLFPPLEVHNPEQQRQFDEILRPLAAYEVRHQLANIADRPLLLWHGEEDDVVPAMETRRLQQALQAQGLDGNLTCLWQPGVKHRITPEALDATVRFFATTLQVTPA